MYFRVVPSRDRTLHRVLKRASAVTWAPGRALWSPGEAAQRCVLVHRGLVAVRGADGRALAVAGPGDLTGLEALRADGVWRTAGQALTEVRGVMADGEGVLRALRRGVHTLPLLLEGVLAQGIDAAGSGGGAGGAPADVRLARVVLDLARRLAERDGWLPRGLTHQLLGELAGLHRATVTTRLNDWIYRDWLAQEGRRLQVVDPDALAELAAGGRPGQPSR